MKQHCIKTLLENISSVVYSQTDKTSGADILKCVSKLNICVPDALQFTVSNTNSSFLSPCVPTHMILTVEELRVKH